LLPNEIQYSLFTQVFLSVQKIISPKIPFNGILKLKTKQFPKKISITKRFGILHNHTSATYLSILCSGPRRCTTNSTLFPSCIAPVLDFFQRL